MSEHDTLGIVIDDSRVMLHNVASHTDNSVGVIYDHNVFIVQATGVFVLGKFSWNYLMWGTL